MMSYMLSTLVLAVFMFVLDWRLGLIAVIITLLASLVAKYMNKVSFKEAVGRQNQSENLTDAVLSFAEGIGVIKSYNLLGEKSDELTENFKKSRDVNTKFEQKMTPWTTGLNILYGVGIAAIFGLSVFLHQEGVLSLAYLLGVLLFVFDLFGPLKALYGEATRLTVMNAALDRIEAVLDEPELSDNGKQHIPAQAQPGQPEVLFNDVTFAYQDKEVLHHISFAMKKNSMTALVGPSGSGKSFFTNHLVRQYYEQGTHVLLIDTGNSYEGLCNLIHNRTHGEDGIYYTYTEDNPISFNPFYTDDGVFDVEKKDSIKTLLLTLWKSEDDRVTKTESGELGSALSMFLDRMRADKDIEPCFNSFYEFMRDEYRAEMAQRPIPIYKQDFDIDNFLTTLRQYYHGGRYNFLLNSKENIDLLNKRFVVFEIDAVKDNKELFPVVTIIIMEAFINKMRRLKGIRKMMVVEEAWKALSSANMAEYLKYMFKTVRKYFGEAVVVTQEVDDIISSPIVKETIINNSDCKILLDQRKYMNRFDQIQELLGLTDKEKSQILSINLSNNPNRLYKEVWIGLGGTQSAVYATEVSTEEYLCYTTEETEKIQVLNKAAQLGGSVEAAIKMLANERREYAV